MIRFSVYARPCVTFARQETHRRRVRLAVPDEGFARAIYITKAQWEKAFIIHGKPAKEISAEEMPEQDSTVFFNDPSIVGNEGRKRHG
jgi:CRISPR/Cas system-associated protein endoribonuclease Cas2